MEEEKIQEREMEILFCRYGSLELFFKQKQLKRIKQMKIPHQLSLEVQYVNLIVEQPQNHHQIQTKKKKEESNFTFRRLLLIQASRELHDADSNNKSWSSKKTAITAKKTSKEIV